MKMTSMLSIEKIIILVSAFGVGLALGTFYFAALWRTVQRLPDARHPLRLMIGSFVFRLAVILIGFNLVMAGHWERMAAALAGFILIRLVLTRYWGLEKAS